MTVSIRPQSVLMIPLDEDCKNENGNLPIQWVQSGVRVTVEKKSEVVEVRIFCQPPAFSGWSE